MRGGEGGECGSPPYAASRGQSGADRYLVIPLPSLFRPLRSPAIAEGAKSWPMRVGFEALGSGHPEQQLERVCWL